MQNISAAVAKIHASCIAVAFSVFGEGNGTACTSAGGKGRADKKSIVAAVPKRFAGLVAKAVATTGQGQTTAVGGTQVRSATSDRHKVDTGELATNRHGVSISGSRGDDKSGEENEELHDEFEKICIVCWKKSEIEVVQFLEL